MKDFKYIAFGITNRTNDFSLLPFFDYDHIQYEIISQELNYIQDKYKLSTIYIIQSTNGFNAFSLDKLTFKELKKIYDECLYADKEFIKWGLNRGYMTLRMGHDKQLISTLQSPHYIYNKSSGHLWFFNEIMDFNIKDNIMFDNEKQITVCSFPSNKHGYELKQVNK